MVFRPAEAAGTSCFYHMADAHLLVLFPNPGVFDPLPSLFFTQETLRKSLHTVHTASFSPGRGKKFSPREFKAGLSRA